MTIRWTPELLADLRRRYAAGEKPSDIALAYGTTRNSILGKAHRLNLAYLRPPKPVPPAKAKPDKQGRGRTSITITNLDREPCWREWFGLSLREAEALDALYRSPRPLSAETLAKRGHCKVALVPALVEGLRSALNPGGIESTPEGYALAVQGRRECEQALVRIQMEWAA